MTRQEKKAQKQQLKMLAAARGIDRKEFFKNGGSMVQWMGGPHLVVQDKKKAKNKRACRGKVRY